MYQVVSIWISDGTAVAQDVIDAEIVIHDPDPDRRIVTVTKMM